MGLDPEQKIFTSTEGVPSSLAQTKQTRGRSAAAAVTHEDPGPVECANRAHITEANPGTSRGAILPRSGPGGGDRGLSRSPPEASYGAHPLCIFPSVAMGLCHREFNPRQPHFSPRWLGNLTRCHPPGNKTIGVFGEPTINLLITCPARGDRCRGGSTQSAINRLSCSPVCPLTEVSRTL